MLFTLTILSMAAFFSGIGLAHYWKNFAGIADNWRGATLLLLLWGGALVTAVLVLIQIVLFAFTNV